MGGGGGGSGSITFSLIGEEVGVCSFCGGGGVAVARHTERRFLFELGRKIGAVLRKAYMSIPCSSSLCRIIE